MILILGGTTEGRTLAGELKKHGYPSILSVATLLGKEFALGIGTRVISGEIDEKSLRELIRQENIRYILDATHPFALEIKRIAGKVASDLNIRYARFEREQTPLPDNPNLFMVKDYHGAYQLLSEDQEGIILTIGVKNLSFFQPLWLQQERPVWVKIYPEFRSLEVCANLGLQTEQIFAFHGSGNRDILKGMLTLTGAKWLVTKESGEVGGTDIKVAVGLEMERKVIVIQRPKETTAIRFQSIKDVIEHLKHIPDHVL